MRLKSILVFLLCTSFLGAQSFTSKDIAINSLIDGTLLLPANGSDAPLVIIIAGSGPTDRNGNQNFMQSNALKKLAEGLTNEGIATFRYDKRIVKQIRKGNVDPNMMFDDFITDAKSVLQYFRPTFTKIYIAGHSQGSLVGMLAASEGADGFISLAGAGKSIDEVITEQVEKTAPMFAEDAKRVFAILKEGKTTDDFPPALTSIFYKDVQPFMSSWMQYNPQDSIQSLNIPVLIINGTKDLQVSEDEANLLNKANTNSKLVLIKNMNHILVPIEGDDLENSNSYNEPHRKISSELLSAIKAFVK